MLAGEVERAVGRIEQRVCALLPVTEARVEAEAVRHLAPGDRDGLLELPAPARMQTLDGRARHIELLAQRPARQLVRRVADHIGSEQDSLGRNEAVTLS